MTNDHTQKINIAAVTVEELKCLRLAPNAYKLLLPRISKRWGIPLQELYNLEGACVREAFEQQVSS